MTSVGHGPPLGIGSQATAAARVRLPRGRKIAWTAKHEAWVHRQQLVDPLGQEALRQMLIHLDGIDRQLAAFDAELEQIAGSQRWAGRLPSSARFRGVGTLTALGVIAEIGDFARFSHPRELASLLGISPGEYSSGEQRRRGHITRSGNRHARRLLVEAAWHYRHAPRRPATGPSRLTAPGRHKSGCFADIATSPPKASARPP
jgi:transposase